MTESTHSPGRSPAEPSSTIEHGRELSLAEHNAPSSPKENITDPIISSAAPVQLEDSYEKDLTANRDTQEDTRGHLFGWRLWTVTFVNGLMWFLVQVEVSIVSTSLVVIAADIGGFERTSWVLSGYLLGFVSFVVIMSKLSEIVGYKSVYITSILFFTIFSGACGAAQSMPQLIIFRCFQGIGAGSCFSMAGIMLLKSVPEKMYLRFVSAMGISVVLSTVLGPTIGGAVSQNTTWRWVFLINVPLGALGLLLILIGIPNHYPLHNESEKPAKKETTQILARIDFVGCFMLLCATLSFTAAFEEVNSRFTWKSAYFIVLIIVSFVFWVCLLVFERYITLKEGQIQQEPVFPWRFFVSLEMVSALVGMAFIGAPVVGVSFQIPQRFQLVNGLSPVAAGLRLIPFGVSVPIGSSFYTKLSEIFRMPILCGVIMGGMLQVLGFALLGVVKPTAHVPHTAYGFEVIAGFGTGISFVAMSGIVVSAADRRDRGIGFGILQQFRAMGSALFVAVSTSIFNGYVIPEIGKLGFSNPEALVMAKDSVVFGLSPELATDTRKVLTEGYNRQMLLLCACGAGQAIMGLLMLKKNPTRPL